jgi:Uma2 family endonuclease
MSTTTITRPETETLRDLLDRLGNIPPERIRLHPAPGTATEADVLARPHGEKRLCELVDGVLVEKAMGFYESVVAGVLIHLLQGFLDSQPLGVVSGPDGTLRLIPGLVRIPDVAFLSWDRFPNRELPAEPVPDLAPDLAVEVLSEGNTEPEMERKLHEYFDAGVRLVWYLDPATRTARVYTSPNDVRMLGEDETLDGGAVLPGFHLTLRELLERAGPRRSQ